jgi:hypothetical protein
MAISPKEARELTIGKREGKGNRILQLNENLSYEKRVV